MKCYERGILLIRLKHRDLMVSGECVYEREHPMSDSGVDYLIYSRQCEVILWENVVLVGVINKDSPLSSIFWNNHNIR